MSAAQEEKGKRCVSNRPTVRAPRRLEIYVLLHGKRKEYYQYEIKP